MASAAALVAASSESTARIIDGPGQLASSHTRTLPGGQKPQHAVETTESSGGALSCAAASSRPAPFRQHRRPVQIVSSGLLPTIMTRGHRKARAAPQSSAREEAST